MAILVVAALLVVGTVAAFAGVVGSSSKAFVVGALCSGFAVVVLWRQSVARRESVFLSRPPSRTIPDWDKPLRTASAESGDSLHTVPEVVIDGYDELLAAEILPSLETLSTDELDAVIRRERSGLARVAVMNRAQVLIDLTKGGVFEKAVVVEPAFDSTLEVGVSPVEASPAVVVQFDEPLVEQIVEPEIAAKMRPKRTRSTARSTESTRSTDDARSTEKTPADDGLAARDRAPSSTTAGPSSSSTARRSAARERSTEAKNTPVTKRSSSTKSAEPKSPRTTRTNGGRPPTERKGPDLSI